MNLENQISQLEKKLQITKPNVFGVTEIGDGAIAACIIPAGKFSYNDRIFKMMSVEDFRRQYPNATEVHLVSDHSGFQIQSINGNQEFITASALAEAIYMFYQPAVSTNGGQNEPA